MDEDAILLDELAIGEDRDLPAGEIEMPGRRASHPSAKAEIDVAKRALVLDDPAGRHRDARIEANRDMRDSVHRRIGEPVKPCLELARFTAAQDFGNAAAGQTE